MWWEERREELVRFAGNQGPVVVYDGETLNDIVFDLLCLDCVDRLLFDLELSSCPELLEALGRLGAGFGCRTPEEVALVQEIPGCGPESLVFLVQDDSRASGRDGSLQGMIPAVPLYGITEGCLEELRDRDVLVVLDRPVSPGTENSGGSCLRALDRVHARIRGLYLCWGHEHESGDTREKLPGWRTVTGRDGILVPARGMGIVLERETGILDLDSTARNLEELKSVFPDGPLWVEPGAGFFSVASVLVVPGKEQVTVLTGGNQRDEAFDIVSHREELYLRPRRICRVPL